MRNLTTGLALGFALGLLLSAAASDIDGGEVPVIRLILAAVLLVGIVFEILRVRRVERSERSEASSG